MCGLLWRTSYKKIKKFCRKKKILRPKNHQNPPIIQFYRWIIPLFQKSVPIGFVLLSIPTTMQNLKKFCRKVFEKITWLTNRRTNGGGTRNKHRSLLVHFNWYTIQTRYIHISKEAKNWWLVNVWSTKNLRNRPTRLIF